MKKIQLQNGGFTIVDSKDYSLFGKFTWYKKNCGGCFYVFRKIRDGKKQRSLYLHREIMGLKFGNPLIVDHKNHDGLYNRRKNLRVCRRVNNQRNMLKPKNNTSGYKGVYYNKINKNFVAQYNIGNKRFHIGAFKSPVDAAKAYNKKVKELFGEFALLNHIPKEEPCKEKN